jgi:Flp pilus assembly protein TadB
VTHATTGALAIAASVLALLSLPLVAAWHPRLDGHPDRAALRDAGWRSPIGTWEAIRLAAIVVGIAAAAMAGLFPAFGAILGAGPSILVRLRAQAARDRARHELPRILVSAHGLLRSGVALPQALRRSVAASTDRIARRPFEEALSTFDLGDPLDHALRSAAKDVEDPRLIAALHTLALGVAERLPIERAASLVGSIAERAVHDEQLDAEVRARSAGVRMQSYLLAAIVPAMAIYLAVTTPGLGATLTTGVGKTVLVPLAVLFELTGIVMGRRIVRTVAR